MTKEERIEKDLEYRKKCLTTFKRLLTQRGEEYVRKNFPEEYRFVFQKK